MEQLDEVNAGRFGSSRWNWFGRRDLAVDDGIDQPPHALRFPLEEDFDRNGVERIEAHFDGFAGQLRRSFVVAVSEQESAVSSHQSVETMEEETAQIGGRRELPDMLDIALPAH